MNFAVIDFESSWKEEPVEQNMGPSLCDPQSLIKDLNPQQMEAVKYYGQALLIGAGAGSGKTRVLTRRIAWLLAHGFWASSILAITFTNKAAAEMRERLAALVGPEAEHMWISTFHSACVRILRRDGKEIGLTSGFSIYDTADCERLVKLISGDLNIDTKRYTPRMLLGKISDCKNSLTSWQDQLKSVNCDYKPGQRGYQVSAGDVDELVAVVYAEYQHRLAMANAVDFDDLIMRTVELFQRCPQVSEYYRHKFRYVFVDEYQDTNHAQYVLVRELSGIDSGEQPDPQMRGAGRVGPSWITVVGDSDQSIYAFRGADIRNIQDFEQDFPNAKTIMLEQNYRSTQTILDAANAVIARNENRKPKKLWTALGEGDKIVGYAADNAQQEAGWIANEIARIHEEEGIAYRDIAIMYRANAQSRSLEEAMINANLPYQLVGGTKFYERKEIKDALAYLQAIVNPADNVNVRRILNVPKRGLGVRAEGLIASYADAHDTTFFGAIEHMEQIEGMSARTTKPLGVFRDMMHGLADFAKDHDTKPSEVVAEVLSKSGILEELQRSEDPQDASRVDNLSQLQSVAAEFEQNTPDATLAGFLETTALVADSDQLPGENEDSGKVTMMTLHTAKGLEYPYVFLTGMEQGTFPHQRAMEDTSELAEERRLAYVGITRAKRRLYVTRAAVRAQWGQANDMMPSQFLDEIPDELIDWKRREAGVERMRASWRNDDDEFGGWDDDDDFGSVPFGGSSYGKSSYGGSSYGSGTYGSRSSYGSSSYGSGRAQYGGSSARGASSLHGSSSQRSYAGAGSSSSYGSSYGSYGSGKSSGKSGKVTTRRVKPKTKPVDLTKSSQASQTDNRSGLSISDVHVGDRLTHDHFGMGTVIEIQDKGANSVITVDFGNGEVKRLLLRMAPIEML
ncbi:AAA family ATPase [Bifidobacterium catenulatum]|nr:AAA family ATPase [Bifidobacterium catenulatum]KAB7464383.1 AAA family ATPase [Bifidobacterium catenulatum]